MGEIKVKKVTLSGSGLDVEYVDELDNKVKMKGENPPHDDLKNAFKKLKTYFADITEQSETEPLDWDHPFDAKTQGIIDNINVSSVSVKGYDGSEKAIMSGTRLLSTMKVLNLQSPPCGLCLDNEQYPKCEELRDAVYEVLYEAKLYVTEQKWGAIQQNLPFNGEGGDENPFGDEPEE